MMMRGSDFSENMKRCHGYIKALEDERRKIQVFQRELPLCLELVTQAIETCKHQLSGTGTTTTVQYNLHPQSGSSEQTSSDVPVLEEFIPMKRVAPDSDGEEHHSKINDGGDRNCKKSDWLRSVQLWNQTSPDPPSKEDSIGKSSASKMKRNDSGVGFHLLQKERGVVTDGVAQPASTSSSAENGSGNKKDGRPYRRKARRLWSPELHRRFLQSLDQLGGPHAATPKQIRDFMKVDELTNDEVKSHLQKYRLHTRRPGFSFQDNSETGHFVVVGGLWVPPECAAMATPTTSSKAADCAASKGIDAPVAAPPPPPFPEPSSSPQQKQHTKQSSHSNDRGGSCSKGGAQSCSPATSSTHTTTAISPSC